MEGNPALITQVDLTTGVLTDHSSTSASSITRQLTKRRFWLSSCAIKLSSATVEAEKLLPMSKKVGRPPCSQKQVRGLTWG